MKVLSQYNIAIQGLEDRAYSYDFEGGNAFFQAFEQAIVQSGVFSAKVQLEKSETMVQAKFEIKASVELVCDRSLEPFEEPINVVEKYIYKFGERYEELTEEISLIPFGTPIINVAQQIFEFIAIQVPMKKLHPRFREVNSDAEEILVYSTEKSNPVQEEETIDPRWAALNKLKK